MKNKLYGNGIDSDYKYIQGLLDSNKKYIKILKPKKWFLIDKTLYIHNGQTLEFEKDSIIRLKDGSNCAIVITVPQKKSVCLMQTSLN